MMTPRPLEGCIVGISVSESDELQKLGFDRDEMNRCVVRLSESLLAAGAHLAFGHDWRPGGVMEAVAALAVRHFPVFRDAEGRARREAPIINRVAAPDEPYLFQQRASAKETPHAVVNPAVRLLEGVIDAQQSKASRGLDRANALSAMRRELAELCHVRVCLGGKTSGFSGKWPGIVEEATLAIEHGRPVYASGIFGGASGFVARALSRGKIELTTMPRTAANLDKETALIWDYAGKVNTGLKEGEEFRLWRSSSIDEIIELVLRGSVKVWERRRQA